MKKSLSSLHSHLLGAVAGAMLFIGAAASAETVAHYRFDGTPGEVATGAVDLSPNGYDLTVVNGEPRYSADAAPMTGDSNTASINFIPQTAFLGEVDEGLSNVAFDDFTVETWVNFNNPGGWQTMVSRTDSAGEGHNGRPQALFILLNSGIDNRFWAELTTIEGQTIQIDGGPVVVPGRWYHVAAVGNVAEGTLTLYVNGEAVKSNKDYGDRPDYTGMLRPASGMPWSIGRTTYGGNPSDWTNGKVDEVRISNVALHPSGFLVEATFNEHPEDVIAHAGTPATFSANFISNNPVSPTLQWEVSTDDGANWSDVAGANAASYTITATTLAQNRNQYRLKATTADLTVVTSEAALLRVGDGVAPTPTNVVALYSFDEGPAEGSVSSAQDSVNGHHLMNRGGAPTYSELIPEEVAGNQFSLDVIPERTWLGGTRGDSLSSVDWHDFTVEAYVRFDNMGGWQQVIGRDDLDNQNNALESLFRIDKTDGNLMRVVAYNREGQGLFLHTSYGYPQGQWTHVAVVGDATKGTLSAYANGKLVGSMTGYDGLLPSDSPWTIGRGQWGAGEADFVNGQIDEVRFSNAALTPVQFMNFNHSVLRIAEGPFNFTEREGRSATFHVLAGGGGTGELTYQWQVLTPGAADWTDIDGATEASYTIEAITAADDGNQYRAIAFRGGDFEISDAATLTVLEPLFEIANHPEDLIVWSGRPAIFRPEILTSIPTTTFQWEVSADEGVTWTEIPGATTEVYTIAETPLANDGNQYRLVARAGEDRVLTTNAASLRVGDISVAPEPVEGVVAHYRFEEGPDRGVVAGATDSSGNGHNLTGIVGSPRYTTLIPHGAIPNSAELNQYALDLRNGNHAVQGVAGDDLSKVVWDDFTFEAWVRFSGLAGFQQIIGRDDIGDENNNAHSLFRFEHDPAPWGNAIRVHASKRSGGFIVVSTPGILVPNEWLHMAVVGDTDSGTMRVYLNGREVGSAGGYDGLFIPESNSPWTIGRGQHWDSHFDFVDGVIDEVRMSSVALEPTQFLNFTHAVLNFAHHPQSVTVAAGGSATFSALAAGGGEDQLTYQWQVSQDDGETWANIPLADQATYTKANARMSDSGTQYRVVASRGDDLAISEAATLTVTPYAAPVVVTELGAGQLAFDGEEHSFFVEATGAGALTYQWQLNGEDIEGATGSTLHLGEVDLSMDGNLYSVIISDQAAAQEGLDPTTVTLSSVLTVVLPHSGAISLNVNGLGDRYADFTAQGVEMYSHEVAGIVPVANWNSTPLLQRPAPGSVPLPLVDDLGAATTATATWEAVNGWGARFRTGGAAANKHGTQKLFHGYIESREGSTVTISDIPYSTYDVYVYPMGVDGAPNDYIRRITVANDSEPSVSRTLYGRNYGESDVFPLPLYLASGETVEEAQARGLATVYRFEGMTGANITISHHEQIGHNLGGIAAVSIVNTGAPARPRFVSWPTAQFVAAGASGNLSVSAESPSGGALAYEWTRDGVVVGNSASLPLASFTSSDSGWYTVTVTDTSTGAINQATVPVVIVDGSGYALISADAGPSELSFRLAEEPEYIPMEGHGSLRADGSLYVPQSPDEPGEGTTQWAILPEGTLNPTYRNLTDAAGIALPGVTFSVTGVVGQHDALVGGGMDGGPGDYSNPLLRDYIYTTGDNTMTMTVGGLKAFAGKDVKLVVYALGRESTTDFDDGLGAGTQNDVATVTLAPQNSPTGEALSGETDMTEGRDLYFNDKAYVAFDAVVAPNGTITWEVGPVPGEPGLNAFNGFQLLVKNTGDGPVHTALESWRFDHFGTVENSGDAALDADPDGDGLGNLLEYALGTNPTRAGEGLAAVASGLAGNFLTLTFNHIDDGSLVYKIEAANDVGSWTTVHTYPAFTEAGEETFTDSEPVSGSARRFLRLNVTLQE